MDGWREGGGLLSGRALRAKDGVYIWREGVVVTVTSFIMGNKDTGKYFERERDTSNCLGCWRVSPGFVCYKQGMFVHTRIYTSTKSIVKFLQTFIPSKLVLKSSLTL